MSRFKGALKEDNSWGLGHYPIPKSLLSLGRFCDALRPANIEDHKVFPNDGVHMLTVKAGPKLSIMAADMRQLLKLGLSRIQSNDMGKVSFYFEGHGVERDDS